MDLPTDHCDLSQQPSIDRIYNCIANAAAAGVTTGGRIWHANFVIPDGANFKEITIDRWALPDEIGAKFRLQNLKVATVPAKGKQTTTVTLSFLGPLTVGDCQPAPADCVLPQVLTGRVYYNNPSRRR